jgi:type I restriction enzyme R subunit
MKENPIHYTSLLERLLKLLEETNMNWEERRKQLEAFVEREMSHGEEDLAKRLGFNEKRQLAIFEMIKAEIQTDKVADDVAFYAGEDENTVFKNMTYSVIDAIKNSWVIGFTQNPTRINEMEQEIHSLLLSKYYDDINDYDKITQLTGKIIELAKIHYHNNDWGSAS